MIKIEAVIRPQRLDEVKTALDDLGVTGMTVTVSADLVNKKGIHSTIVVRSTPLTSFKNSSLRLLQLITRLIALLMRFLQRHEQAKSVMARYSCHLYLMQSVFEQVSAEAMRFSIT